MDESLNVFGEPLEPCGKDPVTGFFRDGCCNTTEQDGVAPRVYLRATHRRALERVPLETLKPYALDLE